MELEHQIGKKHVEFASGYLTIKQMELEEIEAALEMLVDGLHLGVETFLRRCKFFFLSDALLV